MECKKGRFLVDSNNCTYWSAAGANSSSQNEEVKDESYKVEKYSGVLDREDYIPKKPVAAMSYGQRVRIARIYSGHNEFIDQVIRVSGWAKTNRG